VLVDPVQELGPDGVIGSHEHKGRRFHSSIPVGAAQDACCLREEEVAVKSGECAGASFPIPSTARLVLFMEGSHNSSLREDLSRGAKQRRRWLWLRWLDWVRATQRRLPPRLPPASRVSCFTGLPGTIRQTHAQPSSL
jgi:hypothetical protein